jgi:hypothetical protein
MPCYSRGDDLDYHRIKARAALALITSTDQPVIEMRVKEKVKQPKGVAPRKAVGKPVVYLYCGRNCGPCQAAKKWVKQSGGALPFQVVIVEPWVDRAGVEHDQLPSWMSGQTVPRWHWNDQSGKGWQVKGWTGIEPVYRAWIKTRQPDPAKVRQRIKVTVPYTARWTWVGEQTPAGLIRHLKDVHLLADTETITHDEAMALHDALHEAIESDEIDG